MRLLTIAVQKIASIRSVLCLLIAMASLVASAQQKTVTGTVRNAEDGTPLEKATVMVKGTTLGTTTNEKRSI